MPEISIIVPVYKVEKYLNRCIDSILAQTFRDFELILVDNGSPDNCGQICDEYAKKDSRIRVIHKEKNIGVSGARNAGLDISSGNYIMFVDSDDWIAPDYTAKLFYDITETESDIVCSNFTAICEDGNDLSGSFKRIQQNSLHFTRYDIFQDIFEYRVDSGVIWGKLYKHMLFDKIRFDETLTYGEDTMLFREVIAISNKVCLRSYSGYYYFLRKNSTLRKNKNDFLRFSDQIRVSQNSIKLFQNEMPGKIKEELYNRILRAYNAISGGGTVLTIRNIIMS